MLLASPEASYISGAILPVTGGEPLQRLTLLSLLSRGNQPALYSLANREHHVGDGVEQHVDLCFVVTATPGAEYHRANSVDTERLAVLEVSDELGAKRVDIARVVAKCEATNTLEALAGRPRQPVEDLLGIASSPRIPGLIAGLLERAITLARREGVFESFQGGIHMNCRVMAIMHAKRGPANTFSGNHPK